MADEKRARNRTIRVLDEVWLAAQDRADRDGEPSLSDVVRRFLAEYGGLDPSRAIKGRWPPRE